eukprot:10480986-Ditylum_brightwellii.AAC.1
MAAVVQEILEVDFAILAGIVVALVAQRLLSLHTFILQLYHSASRAAATVTIISSREQGSL